MWIINLPEGAGSCSCYNPPILLFLEKELPQNRKKPAFELNQKQVSFVEGTVEIDILDGRNRCRRTAKRPFWAAARVRRTSVLAVGQNLGAGAALPTPSIQIPKGGSRLWRLEPKKKDMTKGHVFLFGGGEGNRTPVRKHFNGTFSGRRRLLRKSSFLFPSSLASRHARKSGESHHAWAGQLLPAARTPHQRRLPRSVATPVQTAAFN